MKKCPKCGKTYDDTWEICFDCSKPLVLEKEFEEKNLRNAGKEYTEKKSNQKTVNTSKKGSSKDVAIIEIAIGAILSIGLVVHLVFGSFISEAGWGLKSLPFLVLGYMVGFFFNPIGIIAVCLLIKGERDWRKR